MRKPDVDDWLDASLLSDARAIVAWTKKKRSSWEIVEYLRGGGEITPEIAAFLADLIAGVYPGIAYREPPATFLHDSVRRAYAATVARLRAGDAFLEQRAWDLLKIRVSDDRRCIPRVARELVMLVWDVTKQEFDEYAWQRQSRNERKRGPQSDAGTSRKRGKKTA